MKCECCGFILNESFFLRKDKRTYYSPLWCSVCRITFPEQYKEAKNQKKRKKHPDSHAKAVRNSREKARRKNEENRKFWLEQREKHENR